MTAHAQCRGYLSHLRSIIITTLVSRTVRFDKEILLQEMTLQIGNRTVQRLCGGTARTERSPNWTWHLGKDVLRLTVPRVPKYSNRVTVPDFSPISNFQPNSKKPTGL